MAKDQIATAFDMPKRKKTSRGAAGLAEAIIHFL